MGRDFNLNTVEGWRKAFADESNWQNWKDAVLHGIYCPACHTDRRVHTKIADSDNWNTNYASKTPLGPEQAYLQLRCLECETEAVALIYPGSAGEAFAVFWPVASGIATPNTPKTVAYYLDQAARCESVNANSAAVAMYRAAVDHIMYEQGFKDGMLGKRIEELEIRIADGTAPSWAKELGTDDIHILSKLGSGAIHTNTGDIAEQAHLDDELLAMVRFTIIELLEAIYEAPAKKLARRSQMDAVAAKFAKPKK
jgi:hypothetical protein